MQPYGMAYSLPYNALHGGAARGCGYAASKGKVHRHEHEQQLTNTCIRCNMYTPPSNSSMHSHMRRIACRPTAMYLSSNLALRSQFLLLGFPFCALVAGHNTLFIHFLHKCSVLQLSLYTSALLLPIPMPIANCCFRIGGCPELWPAWLSYLFIMLQHWKKRLGWAPGQAGKPGRRLAHTHGILVWAAARWGVSAWPCLPFSVRFSCLCLTILRYCKCMKICRFQAKNLCQGHFIQGEVVW